MATAMHKRRCGKRSASCGAGSMPAYLSSIVSALLSAEDGGNGQHTDEATAQTSRALLPSPLRYESVVDVLSDLRVAAEDPSRCLTTMAAKLPSSSDTASSSAKGRFCVSSTSFYGRKAELSLLMHSFHCVMTMGGRSTIALVSGYPGTG